MNDIEKKLYQNFIEDVKFAKDNYGYNATMFMRMIAEQGPVLAAKTLIRKDVVSSGFVRLWECRRLDLTVEATIIKEEYNSLFTDEERQMCKDRLKEYGYTV